MHKIEQYIANQWKTTAIAPKLIHSAIDNQPIASFTEWDGDMQILSHARTVGLPALAKLTFHDRARILKALALYLEEHKEPIYALSHHTGATQRDNMVDIDGGIATLFVYASKGRREMTDNTVYLDGGNEMLSRSGTFIGQHICTTKQGIALHINAFNFPVWGMLEKFAQSFLAGVPTIVKPATVTSYLTHACVSLMVNSGLLPEGSLQLLIGRTTALFPALSAQDTVSFTGSAETAKVLAAELPHTVTFTAEQDSLNGAILGTDAAQDSPEFRLFVKEAIREITTKAGQKCTAMRRLLVPQELIKPVSDELIAKLSVLKIGDPREKETQMGALVSPSQKQSVIDQSEIIGKSSRCLWQGDDMDGCYLAPRLYLCDTPHSAVEAHEIEAFGPVVTLMAYDTANDAAELANKGGGSLVTSVFTADIDFARTVALGIAPWHGRIYLNNAHSAKEATGHGAPLPHMVHGGPGRAGGGEELGGVRGILHYMQRTAIQGSPTVVSAICGEWMAGSQSTPAPVHPFRMTFNELSLGMSYQTPSRKITREDIDHFSTFTGDTFYAHTDPVAAAENPFFPGVVAHGYLLLSFAAGLFVDPAPGPVLANTGLLNLSFQKPVEPDEEISAKLYIKRKTPRNTEYGEVRWHVEVSNQDQDIVATYQLLTMNRF